MQFTPPPSPHRKGVCIVPETRLGQIIGQERSIRLTEILGIGAYGVVYKAIYLDNGMICAVKALNRIGLSTQQQKFLDREIQLHGRASRHHNVVTLLDVLTSPDCVYVVLEYCHGGDLFTNITQHGHFVRNDRLAKKIFLQVLDAVEFCHLNGIYHRDLKPENILITNDGRTAKLADFGLACTEVRSWDFGCGSTFYMSPECLQASPPPYTCYASAPNDVWSLGVILSNLVTGRNPWKKASVEDPTFAAFLHDSKFLKSILPLTDDLDWIMRRIFECDPSRRVTIAQLRGMIEQCPAFTTAPCVDAPAYDVTPCRFTPSPSPPVEDFESSSKSYSPTYSISSGSSGSDQHWTSAPQSPLSAAHLSPPHWPIEDLAPLPPPVQQLPARAHQVLSRPSSLYASIIPALSFTQRYMPCQPLFPAMNMRFY